MSEELIGVRRLTEHEIVPRWTSFLEDYEIEQIHEVAAVYPERRSIIIRFRELQTRDPDLADRVLEHPLDTLKLGEEALNAVDLPYPHRPTLHLRLRDLPETERLLPNQVRESHLHRLISIRCLVDVARDTKPQFEEAAFECAFCGNIALLIQDDETLREPIQCDACEKKGPWAIKDQASTYTDHQVVTIQDPPDSLRHRPEPRQLDAVILDDLVEDLRPGDRVILTCVPVIRIRRRGEKRLTVADTELHVLHVERDEEELVDTHATHEQIAAYQEVAAREDVHEALAQCIAPGIHGMEEERLAALLSLAGAPTWNGGTQQRGTIHVLLCTDPGMAKSSIMDSIRRLAPLAVRVNGQDASGVGLSAAMERDEREGRWRVRAGALIRAHGGHCLIDELGLLRPEHVGQLTTAMDPGQVIVTKAGMTRTYAAQTSIIAAMNPVRHKNHRFSHYEPLGEQIGLSAPILSRCDLIFCRKDIADRERDAEIFRSIVRGARPGSVPDPLLEEDDMRRYIAHAQRHTPTLRDEDQRTLEAFYLDLRPRGTDGPGVDIRLPGILARLTLAAARVRFATETCERDARLACRLMQASLQSRDLLRKDGTIDLDVLISGRAHAQEERMLIVRRAVERLSRESSRGYAVEEDIVEALQEHGMDGESVLLDLERLRRHNGIYPKGGNGTYAPLD